MTDKKEQYWIFKVVKDKWIKVGWSMAEDMGDAKMKAGSKDERAALSNYMIIPHSEIGAL